MIEPKQEHTFLSKKRETELRKLPLPRFQATTTSSCTESDINKDCTFPQEGPISFPAKKEESQPPEVADVLSISFKKHQTFIFLYDAKKALKKISRQFFNLLFKFKLTAYFFKFLNSKSK